MSNFSKTRNFMEGGYSVRQHADGTASVHRQTGEREYDREMDQWYPIYEHVGNHSCFKLAVKAVRRELMKAGQTRPLHCDDGPAFRAFLANMPASW